MSHGYLCCLSSPYRPGMVNVFLCRATEQTNDIWRYIHSDMKVGGLTLPVKIEFVKVVSNSQSESFLSSLNNMLTRLRPGGNKGLFSESPEKIAKEFDLIEGYYLEKEFY